MSGTRLTREQATILVLMRAMRKGGGRKEKSGETAPALMSSPTSQDRSQSHDDVVSKVDALAANDTGGF